MTQDDAVNRQINYGPNTVELMGVYGGDETHALSAWTSTSRDLTDEKRARMGRLLKMLADNGHGTPFEKSSLHFLVKTDIATHIHLLKHRIGVSLNGESARYKELKGDNLYLPSDWLPDEQRDYLELMSKCYEAYHEQLARLVKRGVDRKRAKESARFFLPYGNQITSDVMFNWRSFDHFLRLRYSYHAQLEVREIAAGMLNLAKATGQFDLTLRAFGYLDEKGALRGPFDGPYDSVKI